MRSTLKFIVALAVAFAAMLLFRALVFTIYTVPGSTLEPDFKAGGRVMVNRWSYGLRTAGSPLFPYGRLCRQPVDRGDLIAVDDDEGRVLIGRCTALPGDTVSYDGHDAVIVPGRASCARFDYYDVEPIGLVSEEHIIGRIALVVYNHAAGRPFWQGYDKRRTLLLK